MEPGMSIAGWVAAAVGLVGAIHARRALVTRLELVARACHELRGPITAARLGLEFGARPGGLSAARLRAVDLELRRASLAIDDLSLIRAGRRPGVAWEEVDVRELLVDVVEGWRAAAELGGCSLRLTCRGSSRVVLGNRLRLAQAAGNLIENAIEHGGPEIEVRLDAGPVSEGGVEGVGSRADGLQSAGPGTVRIEFVDDGPGLPRSVAELVHANRRNGGRHGHGLAVASGVATAHGGHLGAAPSGRGGRLVMELPAIAECERESATG
jgi:signal transduction histidine kinase